MYNVMKFQAPFERLKQFSKSPEVRLYKAILTQAIIDATNISDEPSARKIEIEAKNWIFGGGSYFREVCEGADIAPSTVKKITREAIKLNYANSAKPLKNSAKRREAKTYTKANKFAHTA